jgi:hypothetical protein
MTTTTHPPLDVGTVLDLAKILDWCIGTKRITWIDEYDNKPRTGTARNVGDENANVLPRGADIRDAYFRITTSMGFEWFVPIRDALVMVREHRMVEGDYS